MDNKEKYMTCQTLPLYYVKSAIKHKGMAALFTIPKLHAQGMKARLISIGNIHASNLKRRKQINAKV